MRSYATAAPSPVRAPVRPASLPEAVRPRPKDPEPHGWWWLLAGIGIAAAIVGYRLSVPPAQKKTVPVAVRTGIVRRGPLAQTIRLTGVTVARKYGTLLTPQMWGVRVSGSSDFTQVLQKLVPAGSHVRKGDIVAEFDNLYMLNRLDDYRAWVAQHEANLRKLNAMLEVKRKAYEQQIRRCKADMEKAALDLQKAPVLSANNVEKLRLDLEEAKARYQQISDEAKYVEISERAANRATELSLERSRVQFDQAQRNVDRMTVKAPLDGLVVMQTIRRGSDTAEIQVGDQVAPGQPYMQIVDLSSMGIDANLNQADAERVRIGMRARVQFDAYPGLELPAHVIAVTAFARSSGWRGNYVTEVPVRLELERMDPRVIPNFSVSVDLITKQTEDAVSAPRESIFYEGSRAFAFVRNPSGWEKREVELGLSNHVAVAISSGLREGDVVAAEPPTRAILP